MTGADDLPVEIGLAWDDPELDRAAVALYHGDISAAVAVLAACRDDPHRREIRADVLGTAGSRQLQALSAAAERAVSDPDVWLLLGSAQCRAAWQARGADFAEYTSEEQFRGMVDLGTAGQDSLRHAAELAPDDAVPHAQLLACGLALGGTEPERDMLFENVRTRCPTLFGAHYTRLQMLTAKWYGSNERVLAFARAVVSECGPGDPRLALLPLAHYEVYLGRISRWKPWRAWGYFDDRVWLEVGDVGARLLAGSDDHPAAMAAHQAFAAVYSNWNRHELTRPHLERGGPRPAVWPWGYLGEPAEVFAKARAEVGLT